MTGVRQGWLVARRELRERIRSKGLWAGLAIMLVVVVAAIVVPALLETSEVTRDVGFAGTAPPGLAEAASAQGEAVDVTVRAHAYEDVAAGQEAVRDDDIDVLVVDGRQLAWRGEPDERLRAVLTGAIQLVVVQERAAAVGIEPGDLAALMAPVPIESTVLGIAADRSPDDETAAYLMSLVLLIGLATYGQLVLTGVVQEKSSRVVEVLLARMPARALLAGKVVGIGLLGLAQLAVTALAALVATVAVDSVDIPAVSAHVLAWVLVWFVLGYALYAMAYGAVGSLASRTEDASSVAAPITTVLIVAYWAALVAVGADPEAAGARFASLLPVTAPFAMPGRIALGAVAWWEPVVAAGLTVATIAALVVFGGRVYAGAILHAGPTLKLREAWRATTGLTSAQPDTRPVALAERPEAARGHGTRDASGRLHLDRSTNALLVGAAAALASAVFVVSRDVIVSLAVGTAAYAVASRLLKGREHAAR